MEVCSPITGHRGVSLPFTDYCPPLARTEGALSEIYEQAMDWGRTNRWRYLECRGDSPFTPPPPTLDPRPSTLDARPACPSLAFYGHVIDLACGSDALFKGLDATTRRGIRKAQDARLQVESSNHSHALQEYYTLHCQTRRRHGLPPQPARFFDSIARRVLEPGHGFVVTARLERRPVAAAVFFHHGRQALFKFGASDFAFQQLRPNNLVMWEAIRQLASDGFAALHLGRTSLANEGLRRFKLGFGAREHPITYYKYDFVEAGYVPDIDRTEGWFNRVFRHLPLPLLRLAGRLLYPHLS
jgi:hypothetical protein